MAIVAKVISSFSSAFTNNAGWSMFASGALVALQAFVVLMVLMEVLNG